MTDDLLKQAEQLAVEETTALEDIKPLATGDFERRGSVMSEHESLERVIEGWKLAADGCRNLSAYFDHEQWDNLADIFDMARTRCAMLGGQNIAADTTPTQKKFSGPTLTRNESYDRVYNGLSMASAGCYQVAGGHRGDKRWSAVAYMALAMRDQAGNLIRMKRAGKIIRLN